jgi:hypothetical protein
MVAVINPLTVGDIPVRLTRRWVDPTSALSDGESGPDRHVPG